jgi:cytochrome c biogenesis protein CcdA
MEIVFSASVIASFLAGAIALFAPCCIAVLLPAYLASVFREKKNILKMTLVFFSGMATILIPVGLGAAWLAELFRDFHEEMYIAGGVFMLVLAGLALWGKGMSILPVPKRAISNFAKNKSSKSHAKSVFALGVFSGAATSCCAPVLAGAITLAVVSAAFFKALIVIFAYVFGMSFPLFLAAYFYDRFQLEKSRLVRGKVLRIGSLHFHSTNLIAGAIFLLMGFALLVLAFSGNAFWAPAFQVKIGNFLNTWSQNILELLLKIPEFFWEVLTVALFLFFIIAIIRRNKTSEF